MIDTLSLYDLNDIKNYAEAYGSYTNVSGLEVLLGIDTGMRFTELDNLTWEDVDLINCSVRIINKIGIKRIPFNESIGLKLQDLKSKQRVNYSKHGYVPETNYVFINSKLQKPTLISVESFISKSLDNDDLVSFKKLRDSVLLKEDSND
ncbi:tyrosine-type recombinase/integrase [Companilactobacillus jidongensis]|uniref:tyrosine-type recombinase/integrase n=1 Tax=Companilactobacillus jidongensis TaxID=2486006 RepID=UPI000F7B4551|nr:tyrosine-type recombinase/integrase [Companilactobacillus jidongensis]